MSIIVGIEKLSDYLDAEQLDQLDRAATVRKEQSNIEFCILSVDETSISVETTQSETRSKKYAT